MTATQLDKNSKSRNMILHILCWALLFVVPLFFHSSDESWTMVYNRYMRGLGASVSYLLVFYLNYLWIVPRFLLKKKDWKNLSALSRATAWRCPCRIAHLTR